MTDDIDRGIIEQIRAGDRNAFAGIIDRYVDRIYNLAVRLAGSNADADELTQTIFIKTFQSLDHFDISRPLFPWLYTIALNTLRNHCRRKKLRVLFVRDPTLDRSKDDSSTTNPEDRLILSEQTDQLAAGLEKLTYRQREAVVLRYYEQLSYPEIAALQRTSLSAAKMRVRRGLARLQKLLRGTNRD